MAVRKQPRWYFSLRSPYSWFAYRELVENHPDVLASIEWIPYWEPNPQTQLRLEQAGVELPIAEMCRAKNFYILQDTRRWAQARGWTMNWPVDRDPVWEVAHLGYLVAADAGKGSEYVAAAYRARWHDSRDLSDRSTIAKIARELDLDPDAVANACDNPEIQARGLALLTRAADDDAFGVPFFVVKRQKFWGVERVAAFVAAVREAMPAEAVEVLEPRGPMPLALAGGRTADLGHAGGCG
ncbi:DsbA family protein [Micromonospora sp. NPDC005220]|uniref:2-hydroxychromene-2-carboxylate isomerase n=1 Tax=Micromonospora sp. NPDC005220 TaxID=3155589 RepID=UPI0033A916F2